MASNEEKGKSTTCRKIYSKCGHLCGAILISGTVHVCPRRCPNVTVTESIPGKSQPDCLQFVIFNCCDLEDDIPEPSSPATFSGSAGDNVASSDISSKPKPLPVNDTFFGGNDFELAALLSGINIVDGVTLSTPLPATGQGQQSHFVPELIPTSSRSRPPGVRLRSIPLFAPPPPPPSFYGQPTGVFMTLNDTLEFHNRVAMPDDDRMVVLEDTAWRLGLIKCSQEHFYDSQAPSCPHCAELNPFYDC